jgi:hemolysin III
MKADTIHGLHLEHIIKDGGPVYYETHHPGDFIVEPWNAYSSLFFLMPVIIMFIALRGKYKQYPFLVFWCGPLLAIGGMGSTLYHAFRASNAFLIMDFAPIAILSLSITYFFLNKILKKWWLAILIILGFMALRMLSFSFLEGQRQTAINISYFLTGIMVATPILIFMIKSKFKHTLWFVYTVLLFSISLFFRYADDWQNQLLPMGTHWLWHVFGAAGAYTLGAYIYKIYDYK